MIRDKPRIYRSKVTRLQQ